MPQGAGTSRVCWGQLAGCVLVCLLPAAGAVVPDPLLDPPPYLHKQGFFRTISIPYETITGSPKNVSPLPPELSTGNLLAYEPLRPTGDDLLLWLPGSHLGCAAYSHILEVAARNVHTICLPYDNLMAIGDKCLLDSGCYRKQRMKALDGDYGGIKSNNIEARVVSALEYLRRSENTTWGRYLSSERLPNWANIRVAGHSQGAGAAAMIGYLRMVSRVVQFSGVCDKSKWPQELAPPQTPGERFYGFGNRFDTWACPAETVQRLAWCAEGALQEGRDPIYVKTKAEATAVRLGHDQTVVSLMPTPPCPAEPDQGVACATLAHASTAMSWMWPGGDSPYATGLWQGLLGF